MSLFTGDPAEPLYFVKVAEKGIAIKDMKDWAIINAEDFSFVWIWNVFFLKGSSYSIWSSYDIKKQISCK